MKKLGKILGSFLAAISLLLVAVIIVALLTPAPLALIVRSLFENPANTQRVHNMQEQEKVRVTHDLAYPSEYKDNSVDIYLPGEEKESYPVILWVHGGAFVGGDKSDIKFFATSLAADGYAVVCMNYERAPEAKYPAPIKQIGEVYSWMQTVKGAYSLDMQQLMIAGDSAGAQMAVQFTAIQTDPDFARLMEIDAIVPINTLKGLLLYCGPFDIALFDDIESPITKYILGTVMWAYTGMRDWKASLAEQITAQNQVNKNFPPVFITDGNTSSFETHGRTLQEELEKNNVDVDYYFIPIEEAVLGHEYQFAMDTPHGEEAYSRTITFLMLHMPPSLHF